jgi:membrane-associated phospholipid phosphatase
MIMVTQPCSHNPGRARRGSKGRLAPFLLFLGAVSGACWRTERRLAVAAGVLGLLVGMARASVGVHWPVDVMGGFMIGATAGRGVATARDAAPRCIASELRRRRPAWC